MCSRLPTETGVTALMAALALCATLGLTPTYLSAFTLLPQAEEMAVEEESGKVDVLDLKTGQLVMRDETYHIGVQTPCYAVGGQPVKIGTLSPGAAVRVRYIESMPGRRRVVESVWMTSASR